MEDAADELRRIVEDYIAAIRSEKHQEVSGRGVEIQRKLVELLDEDIENSNIDLQESNTLFSSKVNSVCQRLRIQGELATAYGDIVDFVHVWDIVCLSRLVGAIPEKTADLIDFDKLSRIARKSIYLLRSINLGDTSGEELSLDSRGIKRATDMGFPTFFVDDISKSIQENSSYKDSDELEDILATSASQDLLCPILSSEWFKEFLSQTINQSYPMDRFTVLISLWIIGTECGHKQLEHLISELVDQIHHEEANSCNEDELMQLTQIGSFWLSYHKRYKSTFSQNMFTENQFDGDAYGSDGSRTDSSASSVTSLDNKYRGDVNDDSSGRDSHDKLCKLIDLELLHGSTCLVCGYQPAQLLEPISVESCSGCGNGYNTKHCSLSYKPIVLFSLGALRKFRPKLNRLILVNPIEWTRYIIAAENSKHQDVVIEDTPTERVDISEKFEKLTVIRNNQSEPERIAEDNDEDTDQEGECKVLSDFASYTKLRRVSFESDHPHLSESIRMINFSRPDISEMPLCQSDLLIILDGAETNKTNLPLRIRLVGSQSFLWQCTARSRVSGLLLGCGRLFESLELLRSGEAEEDILSTSFACPFCKWQLSNVNSFYDNQDSIGFGRIGEMKV